MRGRGHSDRTRAMTDRIVADGQQRIRALPDHAAASKEIARNSQQAAAGTGEVSSNVAGVTQAATETGDSAGQVLEASKELANHSNTLSGQIDRFLKSMNAA